MKLIEQRVKQRMECKIFPYHEQNQFYPWGNERTPDASLIAKIKKTIANPVCEFLYNFINHCQAESSAHIIYNIRDADTCETYRYTFMYQTAWYMKPIPHVMYKIILEDVSLCTNHGHTTVGGVGMSHRTPEFRMAFEETFHTFPDIRMKFESQPENFILVFYDLS